MFDKQALDNASGNIKSFPRLWTISKLSFVIAITFFANLARQFLMDFSKICHNGLWLVSTVIFLPFI